MSPKLKKKDKKSKANSIGGLVVALLGIISGLYLLIDLEKISGAEFVALSLGFAVIGLIIAFSAEVQEFSIIGNGVKLKELRSEAEKTIEELKCGRIITFKILLKTVCIGEGFADITLNDIERFELVSDLKSEILVAIDKILKSQYRLLADKETAVQKYSFESITPDDLLLAAFNFNKELDESSYEKSNEYKEEAREAIQLFRNLYVIREKVKLKTT